MEKIDEPVGPDRDLVRPDADRVADGVGIGEVATVPTAAAIANAIRDAIGVRPYEIPIRPDRLLELLHRRTAA